MKFSVRVENIRHGVNTDVVAVNDFPKLENCPEQFEKRKTQQSSEYPLELEFDEEENVEIQPEPKHLYLGVHWADCFVNFASVNSRYSREKP